MSSFEQLFHDNLELIEKVIAYACRRSHMRPEEAEDFRGAVLLKLVDDDYAVFRKFQGNSSLKTYLTTVILHFLQDYQTRLWGRWRPCAEAERQGPLAKLLDRLTDRDGYSFDEACQTLWTNHRVTATRDELWKIWELLPRRAHRQMKGEEELQNLTASDPSPDERLLDGERTRRRKAMCRSLYRAIDALPTDDRLILVSHVNGVQIATLARQMGLEQKPLYRRLESIKKRIREAMEREGFSWDDVKELLT